MLKSVEFYWGHPLTPCILISLYRQEKIKSHRKQEKHMSVAMCLVCLKQLLSERQRDGSVDT